MREEFERRKIKDDPFTEGLHGGMMFYEERIAKGELMLVREARLSRSPMDQGWVCSVCNFFYEDFQNEPPDPEQHCRCGAKIIK